MTDKIPVTKNDLKFIAEESSLRELSERISTINWFSNQSEEIKVDVLERHSALVRQKRSSGESITPRASYSWLLLAAKQIRIDMNSLSFKKCLSIAQTEDISRKRIEGFRSPRRKKVSKKLDIFRKAFFPLVSILKDEKHYSWSEIVRYLRKYHKFTISKAYLQVTYHKLQKELNPC
ncbi:MAG: hypothetical protein JZU65_02600 [Chlorobium sp.]|nr:hypothetical protein [Chlorobium sp.]